jgi:hypothetical protein
MNKKEQAHVWRRHPTKLQYRRAAKRRYRADLVEGEVRIEDGARVVRRADGKIIPPSPGAYVDACIWVPEAAAAREEDGDGDPPDDE